MDYSLNDNDSSEPTMEQVEGVEGKIEQPDQWVVSTGHENQRDHVDDG